MRVAKTRSAYLQRIEHAQGKFPARGALSCANLAHGFAGMEDNEKLIIKVGREPNIGIVSSYNEMLSAHAPYKTFPDIIKQLHVKMVVLHSLRAVYRQCVMVLLKVMPVWNYHYFHVKPLRWGLRLHFPITCSMPHCVSGYVIRLFRAC